MPHADLPTRKACVGHASEDASSTPPPGTSKLSWCHWKVRNPRPIPLKSGSLRPASVRKTSRLPTSAHRPGSTLPPTAAASSCPPRHIPRYGTPDSTTWRISTFRSARNGCAWSSSAPMAPPRTIRAEISVTAGSLSSLHRWQTTYGTFRCPTILPGGTSGSFWIM